MILVVIFRGVAANFPKRSILFEKYNFGFRSIFFGPITVYFCNFHRCFCLAMNLLLAPRKIFLKLFWCDSGKSWFLLFRSIFFGPISVHFSNFQNNFCQVMSCLKPKRLFFALFAQIFFKFWKRPYRSIFVHTSEVKVWKDAIISILPTKKYRATPLDIGIVHLFHWKCSYLMETQNSLISPSLNKFPKCP